MVRRPPARPSRARARARHVLFLGDTWAFDRIAGLAAAPTPVVEAAQPVDRHTPVRVTDAGRDVLAGRRDHAALNGVNRWIGGVRLTGTNPAWRWDEGTETLSARRGR